MKNSKLAQSGKGAPAPAAKPKSSWKDRISTNDYEELKATFELFDADGGGSIDPEEIEKVLEELGLKGRSKIVFEMISGLRALNRPIKLDEFLEIVASKAGDTKSREGLAKVFELWDPEATGFIDFEAFKRISRELGETLTDDDITEMMHNAFIINGSESHDGFSFEEFYTIVTKKAA
uniref:Calmodulin n=1 Tax=Zoothamnium arbuscula TaxID=168257 RepID=Q8IAC5_9CILI|nr:spasmin 1 [Zoothamnium arbuscula]